MKTTHAIIRNANDERINQSISPIDTINSRARARTVAVLSLATLRVRILYIYTGIYVRMHAYMRCSVLELLGFEFPERRENCVRVCLRCWGRRMGNGK